MEEIRYRIQLTNTKRIVMEVSTYYSLSNKLPHVCLYICPSLAAELFSCVACPSLLPSLSRNQTTKQVILVKIYQYRLK